MAEENNRIFCVITVARQIEGEYVFIKTEKGFRTAKSADMLLKSLKNKYATKEGKWNPQVIATPEGEATCQCEVGVFEIEIEE